MRHFLKNVAFPKKERRRKSEQTDLAISEGLGREDQGSNQGRSQQTGISSECEAAAMRISFTFTTGISLYDDYGMVAVALISSDSAGSMPLGRRPSCCFSG